MFFEKKKFFQNSAWSKVFLAEIQNDLLKNFFKAACSSALCTHFRIERIECCVFWPANGCFACRSLFKIISWCFIIFFSLFPSKTGKKEKGQKNSHKKGVYQHIDVSGKHWLTPKRWLTPGENIFGSLMSL